MPTIRVLSHEILMALGGIHRESLAVWISLIVGIVENCCPYLMFITFTVSYTHLRYMLGKQAYDVPYFSLLKAKQEGKLTAKGEETLAKVCLLYTSPPSLATKAGA